MKIHPYLPEGRPLLILAPMQDITDLDFWRVLGRYGGPDLYYTEYFRVHRDSRPERHILEAIDGNTDGKPVFAQMIGQDIPALQRTAELLQQRKIAGIDLNLGCPAPIVCRKEAGGGLLRNPEKIDAILRELRPAVHLPFTVKTRIGFDSPAEFPALLDLFRRHPIDALTVHGRTVREMYQPVVHYDAIERAARLMPCPVFANGNVRGVESARQVVATTGARGLMIGRGAIRNPWIFGQIRAAWTGGTGPRPTLADLRAYIEALYEETRAPHRREAAHVGKMKKYLGFIAPGIGENDAFWKELRPVLTLRDLFAVCDRHLSRRTCCRHDRRRGDRRRRGRADVRPHRRAAGPGRDGAGAERPDRSKILISGGGRCNFTNRQAGPENYLSARPDFCKSALARYRPDDFIALVERHGIAYHEKKLGQLFCDQSSRAIVEMLQRECDEAGVRIETGVEIGAVRRGESGFVLETARGPVEARALVVATGGLSLPKLGATDFAYRIARQFGLEIVPTRAGLVPFTFGGEALEFCRALSGVSAACTAQVAGEPASRKRSAEFTEHFLFTHRGLSGPAMLQVSSYWQAPAALRLNLFPEGGTRDWLEENRLSGRRLDTVLAGFLPERFAAAWAAPLAPWRAMRDYSSAELDDLARRLENWTLHPAGTEGYATAEVTLGGIDTRGLHLEDDGGARRARALFHRRGGRRERLARRL